MDWFKNTAASAAVVLAGGMAEADSGPPPTMIADFSGACNQEILTTLTHQEWALDNQRVAIVESLNTVPPLVLAQPLGGETPEQLEALENSNRVARAAIEESRVREQDYQDSLKQGPIIPAYTGDPSQCDEVGSRIEKLREVLDRPFGPVDYSPSIPNL